MTTHTLAYFKHVGEIAAMIDCAAIDALAQGLAALREGAGRLFLLGAGGSAGNCSHAVNDFRKLCGIEAYSPVDNVSELTARTNDEGWESVFEGWLQVSRLRQGDALLILSVGGGNKVRNLSVNLVKAVDLARDRGASVYAIVGRDDGYAAKESDIAVVIPQVNAALVTPLSEGFQAVVWHCLVSHPVLQVKATAW